MKKRTVRAEEFEIVDEQGRVRVRIGLTSEDSPFLSLLAPDGQVRADFTTMVGFLAERWEANDDFTDTDAGNPVSIAVLKNDTDPDGNEHLLSGSVAIVTQPAHGGVAVSQSTGEVTYTPAAGFAGTDTFQYTVTDDACKDTCAFFCSP